jgi:hypothetical protein
MGKKNSEQKSSVSLPLERVEQKILLIRGQKVFLDDALAELYGVEVKVLNQAVNPFGCQRTD